MGDDTRSKGNSPDRTSIHDTPLEPTVLRVDARTFRTFLTELDQSPRNNPRLRALLQRKAPWEE